MAVRLMVRRCDASALSSLARYPAPEGGAARPRPAQPHRLRGRGLMVGERSRLARGARRSGLERHQAAQVAAREGPAAARHQRHQQSLRGVRILHPGAARVRPGTGAGRVPALLSHSGSRGVGFKIANTYSKLAEEAPPRLEKALHRLAWLDIESEAGQEYWLSLELVRRFASANHAVIHRRVATALGLKELAAVENHHNFAWRENVTLADGSSRETLVHRKGATPAGAGVLGIIPGSMGDPGYLVRGRGAAMALHSASHGAGRLMSRRAAMTRSPRRCVTATFASGASPCWGARAT